MFLIGCQWALFVIVLHQDHPISDVILMIDSRYLWIKIGESRQNITHKDFKFYVVIIHDLEMGLLWSLLLKEILINCRFNSNGREWNLNTCRIPHETHTLIMFKYKNVGKWLMKRCFIRWFTASHPLLPGIKYIL